jgi:very-short-patch-repair endonuclease
MTEAERRIWQILRWHQTEGYKFRRQVPIGRYIADFVCHETRLIVEIDGSQHDRSSPQEAERTAFLQNEGYRMLRFWNNEVLEHIDGVHQMIGEALGGITPTQSALDTPSPSMGEGRGGGEAAASKAPARDGGGGTPTQTLPHQGGGLLPSAGRLR